MKLYIQMMSSYAPSWGFGGPIKIFYDYAYHLQAHMKTIVVAGDIHHDYSRLGPHQEIDEIAVTRVRVFFRRLVKRNVNIISPLMFFVVWKKIRDYDDTVILHICESRGLVNLYAALLKKLFGGKVKLVHSAFGMLHEKKSRFRSVYDVLLFDWSFRQIDIFLAQNNHELAAYKSLGKSRTASNISMKRLALLPLNVDRPKSFSYKSKTKSKSISARLYFALPEDELVFLFLGRFHVNKGMLNAHLAAIEYSKVSGRKICMVFAGRDEGFLSDLKVLQAAEYGNNYHIRILQNIYGEDRFKLYQAADIFLGFPLICEETMLASLESLSVGTPCVVSKCNASIPFMADSCAGYESEVTPKQSARYIGNIMSDYDTHSTAAIGLVNEKFLTSQVIEELIDIFEEGILAVR